MEIMAVEFRFLQHCGIFIFVVEFLLLAVRSTSYLSQLKKERVRI